MKSVAVFCASGLGNDPCYAEAARETGAGLAKEGLRMVYGGSKIGLMGAAADGALEAGGEVIGVLPHFMSLKEIAHEGLTSLIMTDSMQERKLKMHELSDAVIALPGGFGTFEELFEMLTWGQLGLHRKPMGLLNVKGYYDHLERMLDHMSAEGLLKPDYRKMLLIADRLPDLLALMRNYWPPIPAVRMRRDEA